MHNVYKTVPKAYIWVVAFKDSDLKGLNNQDLLKRVGTGLTQSCFKTAYMVSSSKANNKPITNWGKL
jgi:hypothetical protein